MFWQYVLFALQVGDLRLTLQRAEQAAARREDYLRHEISELQQVGQSFPKHKVTRVSSWSNITGLKALLLYSYCACNWMYFYSLGEPSWSPGGKKGKSLILS